MQLFGQCSATSFADEQWGRGLVAFIESAVRW